jgi:hypothetical protein
MVQALGFAVAVGVTCGILLGQALLAIMDVQRENEDV